MCDGLVVDGDMGYFEEYQDDHPNIFQDKPGPEWQNNLAYGIEWSLWRWINECSTLNLQMVQAVQKSGDAGTHFYI
jgi:hypothetical protein